ncbi:hypothetical protein [Kocuria sp. HSID16901]|uniref:hypothetical protein n=1 Tax=Kocuria sp. HSID16901 TaxID=2419505 RepID=UPI00065F8ED3|nr:hypothetical protein [Kocuria sp. HSID16901]MCT1367757.1 hypothetical protein [Rothia sp. p3-SID1597]RUQ20306.1 hypothetical protein D8M21_10095 [Kocuria sp. HSID16901]
MNFLHLLSNLIPVTIAGIILGAGLPALFAFGMRLTAGRTQVQEDGSVVQIRPAAAPMRILGFIIFALIIAAILAGILWIAKDFLFHLTGFNFLGLAKK